MLSLEFEDKAGRVDHLGRRGRDAASERVVLIRLPKPFLRAFESLFNAEHLESPSIA